MNLSNYVQRIPLEDITDVPNPDSNNSMDISYNIDWRVIYHNLKLAIAAYDNVNTKKENS